ncbi:MAG: diguanylate cyclase [Proteobacteria bacterium]|nr:MAG: diguanylate cyclase [Pseudomonadota bacterium]
MLRCPRAIACSNSIRGKLPVDELTGLHNRRWFDDMLKRQTMRSSMGGETLSLLLINVDHFSQVTMTSLGALPVSTRSTALPKR